MATRRGQSPEVLWSFLPRPRPYGVVGIFGRTTEKVEPRGQGEGPRVAIAHSLPNRVRANCSLFWRPADAKFAERRLAPSARVAGAAGPQAPLVRFFYSWSSGGLGGSDACGFGLLGPRRRPVRKPARKPTIAAAMSPMIRPLVKPAVIAVPVATATLSVVTVTLTTRSLPALSVARIPIDSNRDGVGIRIRRGPRNRGRVAQVRIRGRSADRDGRSRVVDRDGERTGGRVAG